MGLSEGKLVATSKNAPSIREAVGIFFNAEHLKDAIKNLLASGFEPEELGLLASQQVVERSLGDLYARTNEGADLPQAPAIAFIGRESIGETANTLGGSLFFVGTSGVMGAVVASAAVFGAALLAAVGGIVGVGVVGGPGRHHHSSERRGVSAATSGRRSYIVVCTVDRYPQRATSHGRLDPAFRR